MNCSNCGQKLNKDDEVCQSCGNPVLEVEKDEVASKPEKKKKTVVKK